MRKVEEFDVKVERPRRLLDQQALAAIVLASEANRAWLSRGPDDAADLAPVTGGRGRIWLETDGRRIRVATERWRDRAVFLRSFLRDWRTIGSVTPSSRYLVNTMLARLDFGQARRVVEYGPGTGVFTTELLHRLRPDGELLALDTEAHFIEALRTKHADRRLIPVTGSAASIERHIAALGWDGADAIVSGIPYTAMPAPLRVAILRASAAALAPGGRFLAYQYSPYIRPLLGAIFSQVETRWMPLNLPPAFYFTCRMTASH